MKWIAPHGATTPTERYINAQPTIAGSNPDAAFFNNVLDELLAVITAADMEPTDENMHQIADAIVYLTERAATSGVIKGSFWFGKTTANFTVPAPTAVGQTYIDFTDLKTYISNDGNTWTQSGTFVPPSGIDFTILITSKFWDIVEQTDQQGGYAIYSHSTESWTYWPKIVNLDSVVHKAGNETITGIKTFKQVLQFIANIVVPGIWTRWETDVGSGESRNLQMDLVGDNTHTFIIKSCIRDRINNRIEYNIALGQNEQARLSLILNDDNTQYIAATQGLSSSVVGWTMPNYGAGIASTTGTAATNGFLYAKNQGSSGSPDAILTLTQGGNTLITIRLVWFESIMIPIPKGVSWSITDGYVPYACLYPCFGG